MGLIFGILFCLLFVYKIGLIKVIENFKLGIIVVIGVIFFLYIVNMVFSLFDMFIGFIYEGGIFGIIFSLVVVIVVVFNLVLDFDFIEVGVE